MDTVLNVNQLSKRFGLKYAVKDLSFEIKQGSVCGILGPNGSGKSTTLGMLLKVVNPTLGNWSWFGEDPKKQNQRKIGALIERPNFYPYMSGYQNLKLVSKIKNAPIENIDEKLELTGLLNRKDDAFKTYSLGMKQRLAIAAAMLNDPRVLILDEPTNGLDPQGISDIRIIIQEIAKLGKTILLASHLLDEVQKVCTDVIVLQNGVLRYSGKVSSLTDKKPEIILKTDDLDKTQALLQQTPWVKSVAKLQDALSVELQNEKSTKDLNILLFKENLIATKLHEKENTLEDQFLTLTQNVLKKQ